MMKQVLNYDIHNLVKFRIVRNKKYDFSDLINLKYSAFQVYEVDKPDIVLNIGRFTPSNKGCHVVDNKYYINDNYFYCRDSGGGVGWEVEVTGFEGGETIINFNLTKRFQVNPIDIIYMPLFLPQVFLLRFIEHKLSMKGCFLAHSGAVAKNNQAYILSGRAGCFKTTLCMEFVRRAGFVWLGDERVILRQGKALGFPMNSLMFDFMTGHLLDETHWGFLRQVQFVAENLSGRHKQTGKHKPLSANMKVILLISKSNELGDSKKVTFSPVPQSHVGQIVDGLFINARLEDFKGMAGLGIDSGPFLRYVLAYKFVFPNSSIADQERKLSENLKSTLENIPIYQVQIPPRYSVSTFNQVHDFLKKGI